MSSKILYLGTDPSLFPRQEGLLHYPVIRLIPKKIEDKKVRFCLNLLETFSHCVFTSKNTVAILFDLLKEASLDPIYLLQGKCMSIGPVTTAALEKRGIKPLVEALEFTQEGLIALSKKILPENAYVFYPRSSLARCLLSDYLAESLIAYEVLDLYDTVHQVPLPIPSLEGIEEIVFTSPSTVEGFFGIFRKLPKGKKVFFQGPVTEKAFYEIQSKLLSK